LFYFLKNFLLPYPARSINPEPRRNMVVGSGDGGADEATHGIAVQVISYYHSQIINIL
jgi:hypothetical protein